MARLPPPRHAVHRSLRIPNLRAGDDSPLSITFRRVARDAFNSPQVTDPEDPPSRPERHIPNSIATMRQRLVTALVRTLSRCPCCKHSFRHPTSVIRAKPNSLAFLTQ